MQRQIPKNPKDFLAACAVDAAQALIRHNLENPFRVFGALKN